MSTRLQRANTPPRLSRRLFTKHQNHQQPTGAQLEHTAHQDSTNIPVPSVMEDRVRVATTTPEQKQRRRMQRFIILMGISVIASVLATALATMLARHNRGHSVETGSTSV